MGIITSDEEGHLESVVYFLTEALRAAVESGDSVQQSLCEAPQLSPNMACGEIADRLATYRRHLRAVWSYEVLMIAKIMRARDLAKELRNIEVELRPELDTFRLATVSCADLQELLKPTAQNVFNGIDHAKHFNDGRGANLFDGTRADPLAGYRIAGHTKIRLLLSACEALHFALAARYAFEPLSASYASDDAGEEPFLLEEAVEDSDEAFLLSDFWETASETPANPDWHLAHASNPALPN